MARVLMVSSEAAPFAKTGGLADVVGALPAALGECGDEVAVVLPRYGHIALDDAVRVWDNLVTWPGWFSIPVDIYAITRRGVTFYLVDHPGLYDRPGIYSVNGHDFGDNHVRFSVLCHAALGVARHLFRPQILHLHDWQACLAAPYLRTRYATDPSFYGIRILTTVHNLGYQGRYSPHILPEIGLDRSIMRPDLMEFYGDVNLLKGGIVFADAISTVSQGYAREIQTAEYGFGLDGLLRARSADLHGIVNGVDYTVWDPQHDPNIAAPYSTEDLSGKRECKLDLLREFGLPADDPERPVIGIISRLAAQKGFDIIGQVVHSLLGYDVYFCMLGYGDPGYESMLSWMAASRPDRVGVKIGYDLRLAHKIEAGADMFLMPSHYEPCGLNQIYSLRYGTLPVVRATGGLEDTIDPDTGFKFWEYNGWAMLGAINAALSVYWNDRDRWTIMMQEAMSRDFSWHHSAVEYSRLYRRLLP